MAAAKLIDDRGMKGTGLLDISRAAGVSKGALYFHFASKDDLVTALRAEARDVVLTLAEEHIEGPAPTLVGTARFTGAMSARMREDPVLRAGLRLESESAAESSRAADEPGSGSCAPRLREAWLTVLRGQLAKDAEDGRLRPEVADRDVANLVAAVTAGLEALGREDETWWTQEVTSGIWRLLMMLAAPRDADADAAEWDVDPAATASAAESDTTAEPTPGGDVTSTTGATAEPSIPASAAPFDGMPEFLRAPAAEHAPVPGQRAHRPDVFEGALRAGALREGAVREG
ncbi:hypothetical protein SCATT_21640 [Streptantibioticus cattleyicolor NRRL 8057 = DSM 46488]|uniref:HTH tetR-type domain-containing protein n=1 Tax=Streptantibioticus cattleyicolor (strain ATCC 35852 / DSM 46488 / JCM 4925 / NBRC 14057 / NRRL 8057) TaxID=1003195 RepID=G8X2A0_STREN|nr:hypothetical protein SCATT_21640 [Streptantibioticus cattleyicolor NRRL 8057 = DSM 46488]